VAVIPGIILAAGRSTRMGRPKALLRLGETGPTFVAQIVRTVLDGGAADALIVGRPDDDDLRAAVDRLQLPARFVPNPYADAGQLSSLIAGMNAADHPGTRGILVTLVDLPLVTASTVAALIAAFSSSGAPIVRAVHGGRHGHPVIFGRPVFDELRRADPIAGAKSVFRRRAQDVLDVEVDDAGVLLDVDVPEEYERLFTKGSGGSGGSGGGS
jgi:molybdenum cofactor cytidylyltransferase